MVSLLPVRKKLRISIMTILSGWHELWPSKFRPWYIVGRNCRVRTGFEALNIKECFHVHTNLESHHHICSCRTVCRTVWQR
ncbi:hypothetical protein C8R42DRAFT_303573 [Lentinula raphanica]|nr:hypothetical protein C8R42DRAFT_303573 [Lentinula raphanica]